MHASTSSEISNGMAKQIQDRSFIWEDEERTEKENHWGHFQYVFLTLGGRYKAVSYFSLLLYIPEIFHKKKALGFSQWCQILLKNTCADFRSTSREWGSHGSMSSCSLHWSDSGFFARLGGGWEASECCPVFLSPCTSEMCLLTGRSPGLWTAASHALHGFPVYMFFSIGCKKY